ncbi:hypothetical protein [Candidatus Symbiopectobacterium sp.]|uniref:hypothetical protein n=1 Tax=Candidatus Symbiopectobacterium sp. TaxID=2816440 RepID=UPI0025B9B17D|nr:hypothetical protein [Candidatus Symbiopectobacterium sp.]
MVICSDDYPKVLFIQQSRLMTEYIGEYCESINESVDGVVGLNLAVSNTPQPVLLKKDHYHVSRHSRKGPRTGGQRAGYSVGRCIRR